MRLLETRDPQKFGRDITPSIDDWRAFQLTNNAPKPEVPPGSGDNKAQEISSRLLSINAQGLLAKATALALPRMRFQVKEVSAHSFSTFHHPQFQAEGDSMTWAYGVNVVLQGEPLDSKAETAKFRGEYHVLIASVGKFPTGWRCQEGIRWRSFPDGVADAQTKWELSFLNKWSTPICDLTMADDPALDHLGNVLATFIRDGDDGVFASKAVMSFDESWSELTNKLASVGEKIPERKEVEPGWNAISGQITESAKAVLLQAKQFKLVGGEIYLKAAVAEKAYQRAGIGSLENITCDQMRFTFSVRSDRSISGDYILSARRGRRGQGRWTISAPIRWEQLPAGVQDETMAAKTAFENYVAERGVLPPGTPAPDAQLFRLDTEANAHLQEFRGKVVLLEFWATWCGPCQEPLAKLQRLRADHSDWKDRVEIVTISIDDELKEARDHLNKRGWTNTFSTWAGPGGWTAETAKAFRVTGVPTAYVLDREGKVAWAGNPIENPPAAIDKLLAP